MAESCKAAFNCGQAFPSFVRKDGRFWQPVTGQFLWHTIKARLECGANRVLSAPRSLHDSN